MLGKTCETWFTYTALVYLNRTLFPYYAQERNLKKTIPTYSLAWSSVDLISSNSGRWWDSSAQHRSINFERVSGIEFGIGRRSWRCATYKSLLSAQRWPATIKMRQSNIKLFLRKRLVVVQVLDKVLLQLIFPKIKHQMTIHRNMEKNYLSEY